MTITNEEKSKRRVFVLTVCGNSGVQDVHLCLMFLRKWTSDPVCILASRVTVPISHDWVIHVEAPEGTTTPQMSRYLKSGIQRHIRIEPGTIYCYLDNDVFFLSRKAFRMFSLFKGPVMFAYDHKATVRNFSSSCLHYGTLDEALDRNFSVRTDPAWRIWNSGVYLFDHSAVEFLNAWNDMICATFAIPQWKVKDQGPLVAAAWKFGLQHLPVMPSAFNWLPGLSEADKRKGKYYRTGFRYGKTEIYVAHFYGGSKSKTKSSWINAFYLVFGEKSPEYRHAQVIQRKIRRTYWRSPRNMACIASLVLLKPLWIISYAFRRNVPGYADALDSIKGKLGMHVPEREIHNAQIAHAEEFIEKSLLAVQEEMRQMQESREKA